LKFKKFAFLPLIFFCVKVHKHIGLFFILDSLDSIWGNLLRFLCGFWGIAADEPFH
jgi:hypothetical protein